MSAAPEEPQVIAENFPRVFVGKTAGILFWMSFIFPVLFASLAVLQVAPISREAADSIVQFLGHWIPAVTASYERLTYAAGQSDATLYALYFPTSAMFAVGLLAYVLVSYARRRAEIKPPDPIWDFVVVGAGMGATWWLMSQNVVGLSSNWFHLRFWGYQQIHGGTYFLHLWILLTAFYYCVTVLIVSVVRVADGLIVSLGRSINPYR